MRPPIISFVTFNRMGLTVRNLKALLRTTDDFELHIVDSNSRDDTWNYINQVSDRRIKSKTRLPANYGPIYAVNLVLSRRKPDQYFISVDSDVYIHTRDWISRFLKVFDTFPEAGLLGVPRAKPYPAYLPPVIPMERNGVSYLQLKNGEAGVSGDFIPGHCQCLRPELINIIGYWSEECHFGDAEISVRINQYSPYRAGFITNIQIDMLQEIACGDCEARPLCRVRKTDTTCFAIRNKRYRNTNFAHNFKRKYQKFFEDLENGNRPVYCASIHDQESIRKYGYDLKTANENFNFYVTYGN
jgi:glycosyltransferase involved in cell wall biosynthesis